MTTRRASRPIPKLGPTGARVTFHVVSGSKLHVDCADGSTAKAVWTGKAWHWTDCVEGVAKPERKAAR